MESTEKTCCCGEAIATYETCHVCHQKLNESTQYTGRDDLPYCGDCFFDRFFYCHDCDEIFNIQDRYNSRIDEEDYCPACYSDRYFVCEGCSRELINDDYGEDGYCVDCCADGDGEDDNDGWDEIQPADFTPCDNKEPLPSLRRFGIELECSSIEPFDSWPFGNVPDGSIGGAGREFNSPILQGAAGIQTIKDFCSRLKEEGAQVNTCCGFHLHVEVSDHNWYDIHKLLLIYERLENFFFETQPKSRQANNFCRRLKTPCINSKSTLIKHIYGMEKVRCREKYNGERYYWVNIKPWIDGQKTVEIRLHAGTASEEKIIHWVILHLAFVEYVHKTPWSLLCKLSNQQVITATLKGFRATKRHLKKRQAEFCETA